MGNLAHYVGCNCCGLCLFEDETVYDTFGRQDQSVKGEFWRFSWLNRPDKRRLHNQDHS